MRIRGDGSRRITTAAPHSQHRIRGMRKSGSGRRDTLTIPNRNGTETDFLSRIGASNR